MVYNIFRYFTLNILHTEYEIFKILYISNLFNKRLCYVFILHENLAR